MEDQFHILPEDKGLVINLIREANIKLDSLPKSDNSYLWIRERLNNAITVMRTIENTEPQCNEDIDFILNAINIIWNKGILSPLTLADNEFDSFNENGIANNLRYPNIYKSDKVDNNGNYVIYNRNAYKAIVRKQYDYDNNCQIDVTQKVFNFSPTIYINKGGKITGEQICICRIRPEVVNNHCYTIQSIVNIPVSAIYGKEIGVILTVDHREPKLKVLNEFYEIMTGQDDKEYIKHIDIRKFKKL